MNLEANISELIAFTKTLKVLFVENNRENREAIEQFLQNFFNEIIVAVDGKDGLEKYDSDSFDLIISDIKMPKMNGIEMIKIIRETNKNIPIIMVTAYDEIEFLIDSIKCNVDGYLLKPINLKQFKNTIRQTCAKIYHIRKNREYELSLEKLVEDRTKELNLLKNNFENQSIYYRSLIEANLDPLVIVSKDGDITDVNKAAIDATGLTKEQLIGTDFSLYFTQPDVVKQGCEKVLKEGYVKDYSVKLKHKDGNIINVLYNASTYTDKNGKIIGIFIAARDMTEVEKLKEKVAEGKKLESMSGLIENIGHHWRQPLSAITASASHIKLQKEFDQLSDEEFNESIDQIIQSSILLSKTIDDFRVLFRQETNKQKVDIAELLNDILAFDISFFEQNNIDLIKNFSSTTADIYMLELELILKSIINNIKEHAKDNDFIFIDIYSKNDFIVINIKDSGGGVDKKTLENMFEPYFTTEHQAMGKGMGLYIVYQLIKEHFKGNIKANNSTYEHDGKTYTGLEITIEIPNQ